MRGDFPKLFLFSAILIAGAGVTSIDAASFVNQADGGSSGSSPRDYSILEVADVFVKAFLDNSDCATTTAVFSTAKPGFDGDGYLDVAATALARVDYPDVFFEGSPKPASGPSRIIEIRYANGSRKNLPMALYTGGELLVDKINFAPTGSWSNWVTISIDDEGIPSNQLSLVALSAKGGPHIDSVQLKFLLDCTTYGGCGGSGAVVLDCPTDPLPGTIIGNRDPIASFYFKGLSLQPATVEFDASSSRDPNRDSLSYFWDFGDGATAGGEKVTHTFGVGAYIVKLTVTDDNGGEDVFARRLSTHPYNPSNTRPVAVVSVDPLSGISPLTVQADASASTDPDGDPLNFNWIMLREGTLFSRLGQTSASPQPTFVLDEKGEYRLTLYLGDNNGGYREVTKLINVSSSSSSSSSTSSTSSSGGVDECDGTKQCKALYGNKAVNCRNSKSDKSVCVCKKNKQKIPCRKL